MIVVMVTPVPILLLLVLVETAEVAVVAMILHDLLIVVNPLTTVPAMGIVVVGVVISSGCAAGGDRGHEKCGGQKQRT
jgi:hypothetical protein